MYGPIPWECVHFRKSLAFSIGESTIRNDVLPFFAGTQTYLSPTLSHARKCRPANTHLTTFRPKRTGFPAIFPASPENRSGVFLAPIANR